MQSLRARRREASRSSAALNWRHSLDGKSPILGCGSRQFRADGLPLGKCAWSSSLGTSLSRYGVRVPDGTSGESDVAVQWIGRLWSMWTAGNSVSLHFVHLQLALRRSMSSRVHYSRCRDPLQPSIPLLRHIQVAPTRGRLVLNPSGPCQMPLVSL